MWVSSGITVGRPSPAGNRPAAVSGLQSNPSVVRPFDIRSSGKRRSSSSATLRKAAGSCWIVCQIRASSTASYSWPIDIPRGGDSHPIDLWMAVKQFIREPLRRFRDDLQFPNYRVNRLSFHAKNLEVEAGGKSSDRIDVVDDVGQPLSRILRRSSPHSKPQCSGARGALRL